MMNKRIEQLKGKIWTEEYWTNPNTDKLLPAQLNRFAELIVGECIEQGDTLAKHYIDTHPEQEQVMLLASIADYSKEIKKHFGVEE